MSNQTQSQEHIPVMLNEVLEYMSPKNGEVYVDATFGAGGYTRALLEAADCTVIAIDRDENAVGVADMLREEFGERLVYVRAAFGDLKQVLADLDLSKVDGIVLDIGVSSMQIDQAERGFSFQKDGPLDMRMDRSADITAADMVASEDEKALADLIYQYGEERHSRRIARAICQARVDNTIETTAQLADIVRGAIPGAPKPGVDKATKTFQALRIAVNDELGELEHVLDASRYALDDGGRLVVVTFHSLEDRIVKQFLRIYSGHKQSVSRYMPDVDVSENKAEFELLSRKAIAASQEEIAINARSRSAKLRAAKRIDGKGRSA